jgi:hypothetical protein
MIDQKPDEHRDCDDREPQLKTLDAIASAARQIKDSAQ